MRLRNAVGIFAGKLLAICLYAQHNPCRLQHLLGLVGIGVQDSINNAWVAMLGVHGTSERSMALWMGPPFIEEAFDTLLGEMRQGGGIGGGLVLLLLVLLGA